MGACPSVGSDSPALRAPIRANSLRTCDRRSITPPQDERATDPVEPGPSARAETDEPSPSVKLSYLPSLDGLRAVAVMAVLLYHADIGWLPGGFLGVEVFFVISGYLITSLLLAERHEHRHGRTSRGFWTAPGPPPAPGALPRCWSSCRRGRAGVPRPSDADELRGDVLAALTYVTNWWLDLPHQSYFAQAGRPPLLQHLWSLAVEEQFYLSGRCPRRACSRLLQGRRRWLVGVARRACLSRRC